MIITLIKFSQPVPVPGLSSLHTSASVTAGVEIVREGDVIRLTAGSSTVYVPFHAVAYYVAEAAETPAPKAKRGQK